MELSVYIGNKIKYYREQMGMTQEDLAKKLKTTRQSISRYENGDSMQPLFEDNQILFIRKTHDVRDGQIIVCTLNNETYVKKIMGNRLVSLNKKYDDIQINEYDDFSVVGVVVL